jgi:branched-chain amino acid transport system ATP-binding protein
MTTVLRATGLRSGYGGIEVLHGIDLHVDAGEVVALLGANGAGKTTTLLTLAGELTARAGTVDLLGAPAAGRLDRRARQGLAYLPEGRAVLSTLTVRDNLLLGLGNKDRALELAPALRRLQRRRGGLLSGGEQQLLSLARALAADPAVMLADEVSLGLAPVVVRRMLAVIRQAAEAGAGVLLVEQHVAQALDVSDRAYVLRRGEIVMEGRAADLRCRLDEIGAWYMSTGPLEDGGRADV